jgi:diguanylate cyclase (GGDEF)-like protein
MPTERQAATAISRTHEALAALSALAGHMGELLELVQERERAVENLSRLAFLDELTGLYNRRGWEERLPRELARAQREKRPLYVALLDLDDFKSVNDSMGHPAGDQLLAETAEVWRSQLRPHDLLARYGGEEFSLQFIAWPLEAAVAVVDRLRSTTPGPITSSAGVAAWDGQEAASELLARADLALLEAKHEGRNRTIVAPSPDTVAAGTEPEPGGSVGGPEPPTDLEPR